VTFGVGGCLSVLWVAHWRLEVECIVLGGCLSYCFLITQFALTSQMRPFISICTLQVLLYITQSNGQRTVKEAPPQGQHAHTKHHLQIKAYTNNLFTRLL
jgi:hypothetical protein